MQGAGRICPWDDDGMVGGEQPLWEETSRKLSLNGSTMPKIECKLEEVGPWLKTWTHTAGSTILFLLFGSSRGTVVFISILAV